MGKGDQKTRRGKINRGTCGKSRLSLKKLRSNKKNDRIRLHKSAF
ncbi:MAG: 30S ribosomal protein THX [Flavobacteriales bacterium Tduv]